jgi:hypothetical protein
VFKSTGPSWVLADSYINAVFPAQFDQSDFDPNGDLFFMGDVGNKRMMTFEIHPVSGVISPKNTTNLPGYGRIAIGRVM